MNQNLDYVSLFVELTKDFESPTSFWKWSAYATIAATLRFNCCLPWGTSKLYPNIYVLLLADSAVSRKDAGPDLSADLLKECGYTKVIQGRASWQGIVDELSQDIGNKKTGIPIKGGAGIIVAAEFSAAFVEDPQLIKMMTEGYAYLEEYDYTLRGGKVKVKKRCISMLGGSNETLLRDVFTIQATYGGLLRRTCLIKPDSRRVPNSLVDDDKKNELTVDERKQLVTILKSLETLKGNFTVTPEGKKAYNDWYKQLYNTYDKFNDKTGFTAGVHTLVMKLAMILAASHGTLEISEEIITRAIKEILDLKDNYTAYAMGNGKNPHANMGATILLTLWDQGNGKTIKRREILLRHWNEIGSEDLDKLLVTLEGAGLVRMTAVGHEPAYELTQLARDAFLKNVQAKSQGVN